MSPAKNHVVKNRALAALTAGVLLCGCATQAPLYRWGVYEDLLYAGYKTGDGDPINDAALLAEDIERTQLEGLIVPPGAHAQLGYLYFNQGRADLAVAEFTAEKVLYPESATLMDRLIQQAGQ